MNFSIWNLIERILKLLLSGKMGNNNRKIDRWGEIENNMLKFSENIHDITRFVLYVNYMYFFVMKMCKR